MAIPLTPNLHSHEMRPGITVLGNVAVDLIDDDPPSPGGCPSFSAGFLSALDANSRVVTRAAPRDFWLFESILRDPQTRHTMLPADETSSFRLRYMGEQRITTVERIGPKWTQADVTRADVSTTWVHVAPLLRSDFSAASLSMLASRGHVLTYDGQGLVRIPQVGQLRFDKNFDPVLIQHLQVLKLADEEARALAGGEFDESTARQLGVPEILVTLGSNGCDLYLNSSCSRIQAPKRVDNVQTTGAGDMFTVAYAARRAYGATPHEAAEDASALVVRNLTERRAAMPM